MERHPETGRLESEEERADRNLQELLGELRIALPGVQVLFAFLLVVPFNQRFAEVTSFQQTLYLATLLFAAGASAFLIAPVVHHRINFRRQDKGAPGGHGEPAQPGWLTLLAVAMTMAIVLVTDVLFGTITVIAAGTLVGLAFGLLWYAIPIARRLS